MVIFLVINSSQVTVCKQMFLVSNYSYSVYIYRTKGAYLTVTVLYFQ